MLVLLSKAYKQDQSLNGKHSIIKPLQLNLRLNESKQKDLLKLHVILISLVWSGGKLGNHSGAYLTPAILQFTVKTT